MPLDKNIVINKSLTPFDSDDFNDHEKVLFFTNKRTGIKGIIAIHSSVKGPAIGGCRIYPYKTSSQALADVLRLSKGMTHKAALANINAGGAKSVLIANPNINKTEKVLRVFAEEIDSLGGRYITAEDVGSNVEDMKIIKKYTSYVVGLPTNIEDSNGNPAPYTAYGVFQAILATTKYRFKKSNISGLTFAVQGLGSVGYELCKMLFDKGAKLIVSDINHEILQKAEKNFFAIIVSPEKIFSVKADIFVPCALGGVLNDDTIPQLKVSSIVGCSNNQLLVPKKHSNMLKSRNILYCPDYLANAGGLIKVHSETISFNHNKALKEIDKIYDRALKVFNTADKENITPEQVAQNIINTSLQN